MTINEISPEDSPEDPFSKNVDPLPHFAPFFHDPDLEKAWAENNASAAEFEDLFSPPNTGFHHNPMESDVSYLYIAASPNYPDEVKIGKSSRRPDKRISEASRDPAFRNDPEAHILGFIMMKNVRASRVEAAVHKILGPARSESVKGGNEWFQIDKEEALFCVEIAARRYDNKDVLKGVRLGVASNLSFNNLTCIDRQLPNVFSGVKSFSYETPNELRIVGRGNEKTDITAVPVIPASVSYLWENATDLLNLRNVALEDEILFNKKSFGKETFLDISRPHDAKRINDGIVLAHVDANGSPNMRDTLRPVNRFWDIDKDATRLYSTDVCGSEVMQKIHETYIEVRGLIEEMLPEEKAEPSRPDQNKRSDYLHYMACGLISGAYPDITPRGVQTIHTVASINSGADPNLSACPVEISRKIRPIIKDAWRKTIPEVELRAGVKSEESEYPTPG